MLGIVNFSVRLCKPIVAASCAMTIKHSWYCGAIIGRKYIYTQDAWKLWDIWQFFTFNLCSLRLGFSALATSVCFDLGYSSLFASRWKIFGRYCEQWYWSTRISMFQCPCIIIPYNCTFYLQLILTLREPLSQVNSQTMFIQKWSSLFDCLLVSQGCNCLPMWLILIFTELTCDAHRCRWISTR